MDDPSSIAKHVAGPLGAISALFWIKDTWPRRIAMVGIGCALSYYAAPSLSDWAHVPGGLAGYLLGLFGMATVNKVFTTWDALDLGVILRRFISKRLGVDDGGQP
jgi:hypothetical protein